MRDAYDRAPGPGTGWWAWKVMTEAAPPPPAAAEGKVDAGSVKVLRDALERAQGCINGLLKRTPVRDVSETLAEIEGALVVTEPLPPPPERPE